MATLDNDDKKWMLENFVTKKESSIFATKDDLTSLASKKDVKNLETRLGQLETGQKKIDKKLDKAIDFLDRDYTTLKKKTAYHLGIPVSELSS